MPVKLIVGLGNPGSEHAQNRHNVGFWSINRLAKRAHIDLGHHSKLATTGEGAIAGQTVVLAKPRIFVNNSGKAVAALLKRHQLKPEQLLVIYDDLDLPVGLLRIRASGRHGGQNGMRSIIASIQSQDFPRIRIGIGRPSVQGVPTRDPEIIARYVLANPPFGERAKLEDAVERAADAVEVILEDGVEAAMRRFN